MVSHPRNPNPMKIRERVGEAVLVTEVDVKTGMMRNKMEVKAETVKIMGQSKRVKEESMIAKREGKIDHGFSVTVVINLVTSRQDVRIV
ncbi:hypothetical protein HanRHA438_Chr11g0482301 [Helianthus annuus]|nr:hypothetical protein HanRHA438_Chr11g0482301 [Helianthus annuus]